MIWQVRPERGSPARARRDGRSLAPAAARRGIVQRELGVAAQPDGFSKAIIPPSRPRVARGRLWAAQSPRQPEKGTTMTGTPTPPVSDEQLRELDRPRITREMHRPRKVGA
jgi:hypothetical protein